MKHIKLFFAAILLTALCSSALYAQKQNFPSKTKEGQTQMVDTRIDAMRYWKQMADDGIVPVQQPVPVPPAVYTGSEINAKSVVTGKDDSIDVPVTDATNVSESENSIFVDPTDPDKVLNSNNSTSWTGGSVGSLYGANYFLSDDAGLTWGGSAQGAGGGNSGDPTTAISLDGSTMFVNYIHSNGGQGVARSYDGGNTWQTAICGNPPGGWNILDKNHMWIDNSPTSTHEGNLYAAWTAFGNSNDSDIELVTSTDGGVSWSSHMNISSAVNAGSHNQGVNLQTGPNGEVYAAWTIYDSWPSDETAIGFTRSYDGGVTFEPATRIIQNIRGIRNSETSKNHRVNSFPVMAVDISGGQYNGNIYVVWTNIGIPGINTGNDIDVYMIRSEDDGDTWSDPVRVNQDPTGQGKEHYFPWITCDPETGILSAVFYDDRNTPSSQCEVFCANSFDGGETWEDFKVSDVAFTPSPIPGLAGGYMGDYLGIIARGSMVYPVWTDNRDGIYMTYTSPFVTNNLPKPENLVIQLDDVTGEVDLGWEYNGKDFQFFQIYRDGAVIGTTTDLFYADNLPDYGVFNYGVTAVHDDGESVAAAGSIQWGDAHIAINPTQIGTYMQIGDTETHILTVENTGELELTWDLQTNITTKKGSKNYCDADGGCDEYIAQVIFGDINNSSSCEGYGDFTDQSTIVNVDETYDITIVNGNTYSSDDLGIWIDWNQDDDFEDAGENVVCEADNGGEGTFQITVPTDAVPGETVMRIRMKWSGSDCGNPCGSTTYGEVEDYSINVLGWLTVDPTSGTLEPGATADINVNFDATDMELGTYTADLNISSNDPDLAMVTVPVTMVVGEEILEVQADATPNQICEGETTQLMAYPAGGSGTYTYSWTPAESLDDPTIENPVAAPLETTTYTVEVNDGLVSVTADVTVTVDPLPEVPAQPTGETAMCEDSPNATYTTTGATGALSYEWYIEPETAGTISGNGDVGIVDWASDFTGAALIKVSALNDCGEGTTSDMLEVMIYAIPDVMLDNYDTTYLSTPAFELTGGMPLGGTYSGTGVSNGMFDPAVAGVGEHIIAYTYEENGCDNFAEATIYVKAASSIADNEYSKLLDIFPNPNSGTFNLRFNANLSAKLNLKVFNNIGVEVYRDENLTVNNKFNTTLQLDQLSQGVYYIQLSNDDVNMLRKVIIRK